MSHSKDKVLKKISEINRKILLENESKDICSFYNIPVTKFFVSKNLNESIKAAKKIGFPVVIKVLSPDIIHKSDIGGVILNINNVKELRKGYHQLIQNVKKNAPNANILGIIIEEQLSKGLEVIIGGIRDNQFGPTIMFGLGGIFTEVFKDVAFRVAPIKKSDAIEMINEIKGSMIIKGYRRGRKLDINSIIDILLKVSRMMIEIPYISQIDLNPIMLYEQGAVVADARIILNRGKK